jgi:hypothetical protein
MQKCVKFHQHVGRVEQKLGNATQYVIGVTNAGCWWLSHHIFNLLASVYARRCLHPSQPSNAATITPIALLQQLPVAYIISDQLVIDFNRHGEVE